ncbi:hypothetical protein [Faecalitalea cylindroides]|uniref:hypothetical protein n=1 Tax=Faecalitalea cylindroides TaxID=39483 RepID=UPI0022E4A7AF|nr:hypothetical protein [Faecalitalea cylindroides]
MISFLKKILNVISNILGFIFIFSGILSIPSDGIFVCIGIILSGLMFISYFRNFLVKKNINKFMRILIYCGLFFVGMIIVGVNVEPVSDDEFNGVQETEVEDEKVSEESKSDEAKKDENSSEDNKEDSKSSKDEKNSTTKSETNSNKSKNEDSLDKYSDSVGYIMLKEAWEYANQNDIEITNFRQRKNVLELATKDNIGNILDKSVPVEETSKLFSDNIGYKKTLDGSNLYYYGDLDKKSRPNGWGVLFEYDVNGMDYIVKYIGEFDEGYFDGYGIICLDSNIESFGDVPVEDMTICEEYPIIIQKTLIYEGYFKEGFENGEGINYTKSLDSNDYSFDIGEFKKDTWNGQMKVYHGNVLIYDGETKNGNYHGKGTQYYYGTGNLQYEGEFVNSEYQGKGTLYDEQGNIIHKGEFLEGDIK